MQQTASVFEWKRSFRREKFRWYWLQGIVRTADGFRLVQYVLGELKIEPISVDGNCICFIDTGLNEEKVRAQFLSRGHKFSIPENFPSIRDFTSTMRLHFRSDLVGVALVGARPLHLLSQTALPLKSPTGAFIAPLHLRKRELAYGRRNKLITPPSKEKQSVPDCWVSVKQFSENDTATACQDWLRSTRLGRGSIKSHVRTVKVLGMGLFAFQERVHLWKGVTH